ncbi:zinc finger BED domain-containing protein RICESLEEPER 2 [Tanacetum coccineum]
MMPMSLFLPTEPSSNLSVQIVHDINGACTELAHDIINEASDSTQMDLDTLCWNGNSSSVATWKHDDERIKKALVKLFVVGELPFAFVKNEAFVEYTESLNAKFILPESRKLINVDSLEDLFNDDEIVKDMEYELEKTSENDNKTWNRNYTGFVLNPSISARLSRMSAVLELPIRLMSLKWVECSSRLGSKSKKCTYRHSSCAWDGGDTHILQAQVRSRKKIFREIEECVTDPVFLRLLYHQLVHDYRSGNYSVLSKADVENNWHLIRDQSKPFYTHRGYNPGNQLLRDIETTYLSLKNLTEEDAKREFIKILSELSYGKSVHFFDLEPRRLLHSTHFKDIKRICSSSTALILERRADILGFRTDPVVKKGIKMWKSHQKVCEKEDKSAIGVKIDCVGCIFVEVTTIVEKTNESRKEDTTSGDEEVLEKEVIDLGSMNEDDELVLIRGFEGIKMRLLVTAQIESKDEGLFGFDFVDLQLDYGWDLGSK